MKNIKASIITAALVHSLAWVPCSYTGNSPSHPLPSKSYAKPSLEQRIHEQSENEEKEIAEKSSIEYPLPNASLFDAIKRGNTGDVYKCLGMGMDINAVNGCDHTPLIEATKKAHIDIVTLLMERKATINKQGINGKTALSYAALHKHSQIAQLLIDNNAHVDPVSLIGTTPLMDAVSGSRTDHHTAMILYLAGASLDATNDQGLSALDLAAPQIKEKIANTQQTVKYHILGQDWLPQDILLQETLLTLLPVKVLCTLVSTYADPIFDQSLHIVIKQQILKNKHINSAYKSLLLQNTPFPVVATRHNAGNTGAQSMRPTHPRHMHTKSIDQDSDDEKNSEKDSQQTKENKSIYTKKYTRPTVPHAWEQALRDRTNANAAAATEASAMSINDQTTQASQTVICHNCTLINSAGQVNCTACEALLLVMLKNGISCPQCTLVNEIGETHCIACAKPLIDTPQHDIVCPSCTRVNAPDTLNCATCKAPLPDEEGFYD